MSTTTAQKPDTKTAKTDAMIQAVREHATAHYAEGWDIITEATTDAELAELIGAARTSRGAIDNVAAYVSLKAEQQQAVDTQVTGKTTPKPAAKAKPDTKGNLPKNLAASTPKAPEGVINLNDFSVSAVNHLYLLATATEPMVATGPDSPPTRRLSLDGLVSRHLAVAQGGSKGNVYTISDQGRALAALLWPEATKPAKTPAKPAAKARVRRAPIATAADTKAAEATA
jgi:hypothetical protein